MSQCKGVTKTIRDGDAAAEDNRAPHYLHSHNQFTGKEEPRGCSTTRAPLVLLRRGFAEGFIAASDLISFSYAGKSQVRRTIRTIAGCRVSSLLRSDSWN